MKGEVYGLHWDDEHSQKIGYGRSDSAELMEAMFKRFINKIDYSSHNSYTKDDRYLICVTAYLLNKITK